MLRSVGLFRLFLTEQTDPEGFYSALARDAASQLARFITIPGRTVLDIGGGAGYVTDEFRSQGAHCYLFELDASEMLARGGTPAGAVLADGYWLPVRDGGADLCISSNLLEHVRDPGGLFDGIVKSPRAGVGSPLGACCRSCGGPDGVGGGPGCRFCRAEQGWRRSASRPARHHDREARRRRRRPARRCHRDAPVALGGAGLRGRLPHPAWQRIRPGLLRDQARGPPRASRLRRQAVPPLEPEV